MCGLACSRGGLHAAECAVLLEVRLRLQAAEGDKVFRAWAEHEEELQTRVCEYFTITILLVENSGTKIKTNRQH